MATQLISFIMSQENYNNDEFYNLHLIHLDTTFNFDRRGQP